MDLELPMELWEKEILKGLDEPSTIFVLRHVSKSFNSYFENVLLDRNPMEIFAEEGYVDCVKWDLSYNCRSRVSQHAIVMACKANSVEIVRLLRPYVGPLHKDAFKYAIEHKNIELCQLLYSFSAPISEERFNEAAISGDVPLLKCLLSFSHDPLNHSRLLFSASLSCRIPMVEFVVALGNCSIDNEVVNAFARKGRVDLIEWAVSKGADPHSHPFEIIFAEAASGDHIKVMDWAILSDFALSKMAGLEAARMAISNCRLRALDWLLSRRVNIFHSYCIGSWTKALAKPAEEVIPLLKYGVSNGLQLTAEMHHSACSYNVNPGVRYWLENNRCPFDKNRAIVSAMQTGNREYVAEYMDTLLSGTQLSDLSYHGPLDMDLMILLRKSKVRVHYYTFSVCGLTKRVELEFLYDWVNEHDNRGPTFTAISPILQAPKINYAILYFLKEKRIRCLEERFYVQQFKDCILENRFRLNNVLLKWLKDEWNVDVSEVPPEPTFDPAVVFTTVADFFKNLFV